MMNVQSSGNLRRLAETSDLIVIAGQPVEQGSIGHRSNDDGGW